MMTPDLNTTIDIWRDAGEELIPVNYDYFRVLLSKAADLMERGELDMASVYASIAAFHAGARHCGIWASPELECILRAIGGFLPVPVRTSRRRPPRVERIHHVASGVLPVGGLTRMLFRWIKEDRRRQHSLVLTRQFTDEVPAFLQKAVVSSGGRIHFADTAIGGLIERAKMLRRITAEADLVVLHIHAYDVVPIIALATSDRPPVIFLDHADHSFWLGTTVSDVVANMRESGRRLSIERRGVDPARIALLPTILEPRPRDLPREVAKRRLGLPEDCILLTSVARARKYRSLSRTTYADLHVPILLKHPNCILMVVGPGGHEDWSDAYRRTDGRVIALPEHEDPSLFFQAADIYVDSFPFVSITSVLEAGSYGTPAVSLYPYSDACAVLGCDMPGLNANLVKCRTLDEYWAALSQLVTDPIGRRALGDALAKNIAKCHMGGNWLQSLDAVYELALSVSPVANSDDCLDRMSIGEPDIYIQSIHGGNPDGEKDAERCLRLELGVLPAKTRIREWWRLLRDGRLKDNGRYGPAIHLVPEWARCHAGRFRRRVLRAARDC